MIITIKGSAVDIFKDSHIGTISTWTISRVLGDGATYNGVTYVDKNAALNATVTINSGYELGSAGVIVTMGGNAVTSGVTVNGNTITIAIASVTGNVVIKVPTKNTVTEEPETPVNPTNYTFTINPDPPTATVTLSATGYSTGSGTGSKSITVANGTEVNWSVSADGYDTQSGNYTVNSNYDMTVTLDKQGAEDTILEPINTVSGIYLSGNNKYDAESKSQVIIYQVEPNTTYSLHVERNSGAAEHNANLNFGAVKTIDSVKSGGVPDWATGESGRYALPSDNGQNLTYEYTTPFDCYYLVISNYQSGSTFTVTKKGSSGGNSGGGGNETMVLEPFKEVSGIYISGTQTYTPHGSSKVIAYQVEPNTTYSLHVERNSGAADYNANLNFAAVKSIDNMTANNTPTWATGESERYALPSDNGQNLTYEYTTPSDCYYLVMSNYESGSTFTVTKKGGSEV